MAAAGTDVGTGATLGWESNSWEINSIAVSGISRESIETTHLGTSAARTFMPGDLYDPGEIQVEVNHEPTYDIPTEIVKVASAATITFPGSDTFAASAFMTNYELSNPLEDKITATVTLKLTGAITITDA